MTTPAGMLPRKLIRPALVVGSVVVLGWVLWKLADVLLLGFAAVLFAVVLRSLASPLERFTPIRSPWSLMIAGAVIAAIVTTFFFLLGAQVQEQASNLADELPQAISSFGYRIGVENLPERLWEQAQEIAGRSAFTAQVVNYTSVLLSATTGFVLIIIAGAYLAARPQRYRDGLLQLVPKDVVPEAGRALDNVGRALRLWLLGQFISMLAVGTLTVIGLYILGMPSALALGIFSGLAAFIPVIGAIASAVPAVLIAMGEGGNMVLWVIGLYILVQQIEGDMVMPLVQRKVVDLPPVLALFAILGFGVMFGLLGVLLGTPLAVAVHVLVKQLYIQDALGKETKVPGSGG